MVPCVTAQALEQVTVLLDAIRDGKALLRQKKFAEAEPYLVSGYEGLEKRKISIPVPDQKRVLPAAGKRVVGLYEQWGKPEKAAECRARVQAN